jgi:hypothetical protein
MRKILLTLALIVGLISSAAAQQVVTTGKTTYSGTISLTAATSTPLTAANVTMSPGSPALPPPGGFGKLTIIAPGSGCQFTVNWQGGAATATSGEQFGGTNLSSDTVDLTGQANAPSLFSTAGCSSPNVVQFRN